MTEINAAPGAANAVPLVRDCSVGREQAEPQPFEDIFAQESQPNKADARLILQKISGPGAATARQPLSLDLPKTTLDDLDSASSALQDIPEGAADWNASLVANRSIQVPKSRPAQDTNLEDLVRSGTIVKRPVEQPAVAEPSAKLPGAERPAILETARRMRVPAAITHVTDGDAATRKSTRSPSAPAVIGANGAAQNPGPSAVLAQEMQPRPVPPSLAAGREDSVSKVSSVTTPESVASRTMAEKDEAQLIGSFPVIDRSSASGATRMAIAETPAQPSVSSPAEHGQDIPEVTPATASVVARAHPRGKVTATKLTVPPLPLKSFRLPNTLDTAGITQPVPAASAPPSAGDVSPTLLSHLATTAAQGHSVAEVPGSDSHVAASIRDAAAQSSIPSSLEATPEPTSTPLNHPTEVRTLTATSQTLEVGVAGGTHGWLRVRAELTQSGEVSASVIAGTGRAAQVLHGELPALGAFLAREHVNVSAVGIAVQTTADASTFATGPGFTGGSNPGQRNSEEPAWRGPGLGKVSFRFDQTSETFDSSPVANIPALHGSGGWVSVRV